MDGRRLAVGGPNLLVKLNATPPPELRRFTEEAATQGQGTLYLVEAGRVLAAFAVADAVRPESVEAVSRLHANGVEVVMLTGDAQAVADAVANQLGIDAKGLEHLVKVYRSRSVKTIRDGFHASGGNVRMLMVQIAESDAFRLVRSSE